MKILIILVPCYSHYEEENDCSRVFNSIDIIAEGNDALKQITSIEHMEGSNLLVAGTFSGHVELWDFQSGNLLSRFNDISQEYSI